MYMDEYTYLTIYSTYKSEYTYLTIYCILGYIWQVGKQQISTMCFSYRMRDAISRQINAQYISKCKGNNIGEDYRIGLAIS